MSDSHADIILSSLIAATDGPTPEDTTMDAGEVARLTEPQEVDGSRDTEKPEGSEETEETEDPEPQSYGFNPLFYGEGTEDLEEYRLGGLHPFHLGDKLAEGRFEAVNKLGAGGSATVWLCADFEKGRYVAIKILSAAASQAAYYGRNGEFETLKYFKDTKNAELDANHICLAEDYFIETGPNGEHMCLILPVLGGDIKNVPFQYGDEPEVLRGICGQLVKAMKYLHGKGICHGDFRPANILFKIPDFDNATDEEVFQMFPQCDEYDVGPIPASGEEGNPHVPHTVYPPTFFHPLPGQKLRDIVVSDFGEAYLVDKPPTRLGIPRTYAAPEAIFDVQQSFGFATDIWALGATLCEVRQGSTSFNGMTLEHLIHGMERDMGILPEPYRSKWFEYGLMYWGDDRSEEEIAPTDPVTLDWEHLQRDRQSWKNRCGYDTCLEKIVRKKMEVGMWPVEGVAIDPTSLKPNERLGPDGVVYKSWQTSTEEADLLLDLLSRIFKYHTEERLTMPEIVSHPWVQGCFSTTSPQDNDMNRVVEGIVDEVVEDAATETMNKIPDVLAAERALSASTERAAGSAEGSLNDEDEVMVDAEPDQGPVEPENGDDKDSMSLTSSPVMVAAEIVPTDENEVFHEAEDRGLPAEVVVVDFMAGILGWIKSFFPPPVREEVGGCVGI